MVLPTVETRLFYSVHNIQDSCSEYRESNRKFDRRRNEFLEIDRFIELFSILKITKKADFSIPQKRMVQESLIDSAIYIINLLLFSGSRID
jgi:hypothetical protein